MRIEFALRGRKGHVEVLVERNEQPQLLGCDLLVPGLGPDHYRSFPACTATVNYDAAGYGSVLGWVQTVRSTDNSSKGHAFDMDPIALYSGLATPFCWFGVRPTLFDAPFRFRDSPVEWLAHSFLCFTPTAVCDHEVRAVLGFAWGFAVKDGDVDLHQPEVLDASQWDARVPLLRASYPDWSFTTGWHDN